MSAAALRSAGLVLWRRTPTLEVFLAHMGGPLWATKDAAAWTIPKGLFGPEEDPLAAAIREFTEEIGMPPRFGECVLLGEFRQSSGKIVTAFAAEPPAPDEVAFVASNTFSMEWPPRSGRMQEFPEVDGARWLALPEARIKIVRGQLPVLDAVERLIG